jgi:hypothetical protein
MHPSRDWLDRMVMAEQACHELYPDSLAHFVV